MEARSVSMGEEPTGADPAQSAAFAMPLSRDPQATRRRVLAVTVAFVIHAAVIVLVLVRLPTPKPKPQITSASIMVELVTAAAVQPAARASAAPRSSQPTDGIRESGGRSDRTPDDAKPAPPPAGSPAPSGPWTGISGRGTS